MNSDVAKGVAELRLLLRSSVHFLGVYLVLPTLALHPRWTLAAVFDICDYVEGMKVAVSHDRM